MLTQLLGRGICQVGNQRMVRRGFEVLVGAREAIEIVVRYSHGEQNGVVLCILDEGDVGGFGLSEVSGNWKEVLEGKRQGFFES